jgi:phosphoribosylamine--glycine ligase
MGTSMFWGGRNELFEATLGKFEGWLAEEGYVGSIDINCIVDATGIYPLEFTPRFGYPTITLQQETFRSETGRFLHDLARGRNPSLETHPGFAVGVRLVLPPFPFNDEATYAESSRDAALVFADAGTPDTDRQTVSGTVPAGVHIEDAKRVAVDGGHQWRVAGENGMPLVVTGTGETMAAAREQAYHRIDRITVPNCYYRDDIGERWVGDGDRLLAWGYLGP